jgi:para-aminobenzoate synthetase/4-amino-4-deoxychorismate lyase
LTGPRTWAAFDFPEDPPDRRRRLRGRFLRPPDLVLRAAAPADVPEVVAQAEAEARAGRWVLGGLGYGAAGAWDAGQAALRDSTPCAHFEVFDGQPDPWPDEPADLPALDWRRHPDESGTAAEGAIGRVLDHIAAGDCYQVNLTGRWWAGSPESTLHEYFLGLAAAQPGGYALFSETAGVASVSPELFLHWQDGRLVPQPMKGTAAADAGPAALASAKERAENLMIVDLLRNDLGRVCRTGSVSVERLFEVHRLPTVWQLTSTVAGRTDPGVRLGEVLAALFPCGSVTGAPKLAAMTLIARLEDSARGWYCGALGLLRPGGTATFNVPIRTVVRGRDGWTFGTGSGIVADSDPVAEVAEWRAKTAVLGGVPLRALETMLLIEGRVRSLEAHLARLAATCAAHGLALDAPEARDAVLRAASALRTGRHRLRLVAGGGPVEVVGSAAPVQGGPVTLRLAPEPLDAEGPLGPVIRHKTTHRAHYRRRRASVGAAVDDAICQNSRGELTECTTGNLAVRLDGEWFTPPVSAGLLPGVFRAEALAAGRIAERTLTVDDLRRADDLALLNSLRGWCPARLR